MTDTTTADKPGAILLALRLESWAEYDEGLRGDDMRTAAITLCRLHALAAQDAKDAARYRHIREEPHIWQAFGELVMEGGIQSAEKLDATIDAARAKEGKA